MRSKLVIFAALVATAVIGVGIGIAQGAASHPNTRPTRIAARPSTAPFTGRAQTMFAVVNSTGTLARGFGAASAAVDGSPGQYQVLFKRGVSKCAFVATLGSSGSNGRPPIGEIGVVGLNGRKAGVYVETYDSTGTLTAAGFHLVVTCPPPS
jgi:hypothetical protein